MDSVWMAGQPAAAYPPMAGEQQVETVVVGGGITGLATALLLAEAGQRVALLEARRIGAGNTGRSTGNLYGTLSRGLAPLREKWEADAVRAAVAARLRAVDTIERHVARHAIECGFARRPLYRCVAGDDARALQALQDEFDANAEAGLAPRWVETVPGLPFPVRRSLQIDGQAQCNPYLYAQGLARALAALGARVHEGSAVVELDAGEGLAVTEGGRVRAERIVLATHTPKGFNLVQAEMEVYREYGLSSGLASRAAVPEGIYWLRDQGRSLRGCHDDTRTQLVVVGELHRTGEGEEGVDYHRRLQAYVERHFEVEAHIHRWSAQQYRSADGLPYIGRSAHDNVYIATGFGADGLTWGVVAAELIAGLVRGEEDAVARLLDPRRFTPAKSARGWASESAAVAGHLVGDRLGVAEHEQLSDVPAGEGRILEVNGRKHAVYRSPGGALTVLSPVCPHLKCHVRWNGAARSWDCPCHGSRFEPDGRVIEGPALHPLERRVLPAREH